MGAVTPTLAGFNSFLQSPVGLTGQALTDAQAVSETAFCMAMETVNTFICAAAPMLYVQAVYNLAADIVFNIALDTAPSTYFQTARQTWNIFGFVAGVVNAAGDNGTSDSLTVPESLGQLTLADLQNLKTPYGRAYLAIAQKWGPDLFGIT